MTARAWDPKAKRVFSAPPTTSVQHAEIGLERKKVSNDLGGGAIHISGSSAIDQGEVEALAKATLDRIANAYVEAEAHVLGNPKIKAGVKLKITGVGTAVQRRRTSSAPCATASRAAARSTPTSRPAPRRRARSRR